MRKIFKYSLPIGIAGTIIFLVLFITNAFYELLIPIVENSSLEGAAFAFWDNFLFYLPLLFMVLFIAYAAIGVIITKTTEDKSLDSAIKEAIQPVLNDSEEIKKKREWLSHDYHATCPKCGSPRKTDESTCRYCGQDLLKK